MRLPVVAVCVVLGASASAQERYVPVAEGVRLHYRAVSRGDGGGGGNALETWMIPAEAWLYPALLPLAEGRRLIFFDTRGRGASDPVERDEDLSFWFDVADIETLQDALGIEKAWILGWSYLGAVAGRYAIDYPDRVSGLVLVGPLGPRALTPDDVTPADRDETGVKELERMREDGIDISDPERFCRAENALFIDTRVPDERARARIEVPCELPNEWSNNVARVFARAGESLGSWDWRGEAQTVPVRTLVIVGSQDPGLSAQHWADSLPGATLTTLDGVGHFPWVESPAAFFGAVRDFVALTP